MLSNMFYNLSMYKYFYNFGNEHLLREKDMEESLAMHTQSVAECGDAIKLSHVLYVFLYYFKGYLILPLQNSQNSS